MKKRYYQLLESYQASTIFMPFKRLEIGTPKKKSLPLRNWKILGVYLIAALSITSVSWANQTTCRESLQHTTGLSVPTTKDLDDLINQLTAGTVEEKSAEPVILSSNQLSNSDTTYKDTPLTATARAGAEHNPHSMGLEELLQSMGLKPYLVRIAAAEILKSNEHGQYLTLKNEVKALLEAIVNDSLSVRQKIHLASHRDILKEIVDRSGAVHRVQLIKSYGQSDPPPTPKNIADIYYSPVGQSQVPRKKSGLLSYLFGSSHSQDPSPSLEIPYENPVQFARAISDYTDGVKLDIIEDQVQKMGFLTHLEIYEILTALPVKIQEKAYNLLKQQLIGRVDFYPLEVLKLAADVDNTTTLNYHPVKANLLLWDLRQTGTKFDTFEVYALLKRLEIHSDEIAKFLTERHLTFDQFQEFMQKRSSPLPIDEALLFTRILINGNSNSEQVDKVRDFLKSVYTDEEHMAKIDQVFPAKLEPSKEDLEAPAPLHDRETKDNAGHSDPEKTQVNRLLTISRVAKWDIAWIGDLLAFVEELAEIEPLNDKAHALRIEILEKALDPESRVRFEAFDLLKKIVQKKQDALSQNALLSTLIDPLLKAQAIQEMKPANEEIQEMAINVLVQAQNHERKEVRSAAGQALCHILQCEIPQKHLNRITSFQSNSKDDILAAIKALKDLRPKSIDLKERRLRLIGRYLGDPESYFLGSFIEAPIDHEKFLNEIRISAANALFEIARDEQDFVTQATILTGDVSWDNRPKEALIQLLKAVGIMKPANPSISNLQLKVLTQASSTTIHPEVREKAKLLECFISQCQP